MNPNKIIVLCQLIGISVKDFTRLPRNRQKHLMKNLNHHSLRDYQYRAVALSLGMNIKYRKGGHQLCR